MHTEGKVIEYTYISAAYILQSISLKEDILHCYHITLITTRTVRKKKLFRLLHIRESQS